MNRQMLASPRPTRPTAPIARLAWSTLLAVAGPATVGISAIPAAQAKPVAPAATAKLYAAPSGHGTACSRSRPCPAATAVKEAVKDFKFFNVRVIVHLARGTYHTRLNAVFLPPNGAKSVTIEGPSRGRPIINAGGAGPALELGADTPPMTVIGLQLTRGRAPRSTGIGGGVLVGGGDVTIIDSVITDNTARVGAGIGAAGGHVIVRSSTISRNQASDTGGGISDTGGIVTVIASTVSGNLASGGFGGGIYAEDTSLTVRDSTIVGNTVRKTMAGTGSGGGIALQAVGGQVIATVLGTTLAGNIAAVSGGGAWAVGKSTLRIGGNILAANSAPAGAECSAPGATVTDLGFNVIDDASCPHRASTEVVKTAAIGLHRLARNGGPTSTERIGATSAAHDVVPVGVRLSGTAFCAGADQRGVPRRQGPARRCDAGAYQFAPPHIVRISPARGRPGSKIAITGYGFDFLSLHFGSAQPRFAVNRSQTAIAVRVPSRRPGSVTITLSNVDGTASRTFKITR